MDKANPQIGGSNRGPGQLDEAKNNRGLGRGDVTRDENDEEALADGTTTEGQQRAAARKQADEAARTPKRPTEEAIPRRAKDDEEKGDL